LFIAILVINVRRIAIDMIKKPKSFRTLHIFSTQMTASIHDTKLPPVALVVIAVLLWSTGGLFIKLTALDAYQVTFFRSLLAGITVAILNRKQGLRINLFGVLRR
jgi:hypothetical protein